MSTQFNKKEPLKDRLINKILDSVIVTAATPKYVTPKHNNHRFDK